MKKIDKLLLLTIFNFLVGHISFGQQLDTTIYRHLLEANNAEFIKYAQSVGLTTDVDSSTNLLTAKTKGLLFFKQISDTATTKYKLQMIVSTLDKDNNKLILKNAKLIDSKADMWQDEKYLYRQWDLENAISKEMWYKVLVYGLR